MSRRRREDLTTEQSTELDGCMRMTQLMTAELEKRKQERAQYDALYAEYVRQRAILNASRAIAATKCTGACANGGGAIRYGCDPICTNIQFLNPDLIEPTAPVWGSLGNFVCSSCRQSVNIDATAGDAITVAENAVNQQMQCTSELRDAYDRTGAHDDTDEYSEQAGAGAGAGASASTGASANTVGSISTMVIIFILIMAFVLLAACAIVAYIVLADDEGN